MVGAAHTPLRAEGLLRLALAGITIIDTFEQI